MSDTWESVGSYVLVAERACEANDHQAGAFTIANKSWTLSKSCEVLGLLPPGSENHVKKLLLENAHTDKSWI